MDDSRFDQAAREALSLDAGLPNERVWTLARRKRDSWLPTEAQSLAAGLLAAALLTAFWFGAAPPRHSEARQSGFRIDVYAESKTAVAAATQSLGSR